MRPSGGKPGPGRTGPAIGRASALLLALGALLALASPAVAGVRPMVTGVSNLGTDNPLGFERVREAGAQTVRIPLYWAAAAPRSRPAAWNPADPNDPNYNWAEATNAVRKAVAAGLIPVLQVDGAPPWAQRCTTPSSLGSAICDPSPADLKAFGTALARRFDGSTPGVPAVGYYQALNEPNLSLFFFPQYETNGRVVSPFLYRDLLNAFYAGVKAGAPGSVVVAAGLGPNAVPEYTIGPMQFARKMLCMVGSSSKPRPAKGNCGGGVHFDVFAIQPYTTGGPTHKGRKNDVQLGDLWKLKRLLRAAERAGRISGAFRRTPIWITEFSWDSRPPDPGGVPMPILTRWTAEALHKAWSAGVSRFFWFSLNDETRDHSKPYSESLESGLYFRGATLAQDRPKPNLRAFHFPFVAYPRKGHLRYWGRTPNSGPGRLRIQVKRGGKWRTAKAVRADSAGIFRGSFRSRYGGNKRGAVRAVFRRHRSPAFSMKPVRDYYQRPFG